MNSARGKLQKQTEQILCKKISTRQVLAKAADFTLNMFSISLKNTHEKDFFRSFYVSFVLKMQTALRLSYNKT